MLDHLQQINEHTNTVIVTQVICQQLSKNICRIILKIELHFVSYSCVWHLLICYYK